MYLLSPMSLRVKPCSKAIQASAAHQVGYVRRASSLLSYALLPLLVEGFRVQGFGFRVGVTLVGLEGRPSLPGSFVRPNQRPQGEPHTDLCLSICCCWIALCVNVFSTASARFQPVCKHDFPSNR